MPLNGVWPTLEYSDGATADTGLLLLFDVIEFELADVSFALDVDRAESLRPSNSWMANGDRCGSVCELNMGRLSAAGAVTWIVSGRGIVPKFIAVTLGKIREKSALFTRRMC